MTPATKRFSIAIPSMMRPPQHAKDEFESCCEAFVWVDKQRAVILFIDVGGGVSVTNAIDQLIPFVIEGQLRQQGVSWQDVLIFGRDSMGAFDQVLIDVYDGSGTCEANWLPMPARIRTLDGFRKISASIGFDICDADIKAIQLAVKRANAQIREAA